MITFSSDTRPSPSGSHDQALSFQEASAIQMFEYSVVELLECYTDATGIGLVFMDASNNIHPGSTARRSFEDLKRFDFDEVQTRLLQIKDKLKETGFYFETFFTVNHFTFNIHLLKKDRIGPVFLVSEPMTIQPMNDPSIRRGGSQTGFSDVENGLLPPYQTKAPVVTWRRVYQLGMILNRMCQSALLLPLERSSSSSGIQKKSLEVQQTQSVKSGLATPGKLAEPGGRQVMPNSLVAPSRLVKQDSLVLPSQRMAPLELDETNFQKVREIVMGGDLGALAEFQAAVNTRQSVDQSSDGLPGPLFGMQDRLRIAKYALVMHCTMHLISAIESGRPFEEMMALADQLIGEAERLSQPRDVYAYTQVSLSAFTQAVHESLNRQYSRPVHAFISYVHRHYQERITLETVAAHVGLNPSYLSNMVMKETGLSMADHINQTRIEASKHDLLHTNKPIHEIAQHVGYTYQNHYARHFKRLMGVTPVEYRERKAGAKDEG